MRAAIVLALLACAARAQDIVVRVTVGEEPVHNAAIKVLKKDDGIVFDRMKWAADKLTDESGQAVVDVPEDGKVLVYLPGFALAVATVDRIPLDIELRPERIYEGRVVDSKGDPVAGAAVTLNTTFKRRATFLATSDKEGRFFVYGLWLDDYVAGIEAPGFLPAHGAGPKFTLTRFSSIAGILVDGDATPLAGVTVQIGTTDSNGEVEWNAGLAHRTGADGRFRFERLLPGWYRVAPAVPRGGNADLTIREGEKRTDTRLVALAPATLTLKVVDEKGKPLAKVASEETKQVTDERGVISFIVPPGYPDLERELTMDGFATQTISFGPEKPGVTRDLGTLVLVADKPSDVTVLLPNGKPAQKGNVEGIKIKDGKATVPMEGRWTVEVPGYPRTIVYAPGTVTLPEPVWIEGEVRDTEGKPIEGVQVTADTRSGFDTFEEDPSPLLSDATGKFRFGPYEAGRVSIEAKKAGYRDHSVTVTLSGGSLLITLKKSQPPELLGGRVTRDGIPVQDFTIAGERFMNEDGRFEINLDRAQDRWVSLSVGRDFYTYATPPPGQPLEVRLPSGRIRVELTGIQEPTNVRLSHGNLYLYSRRADEDGVVHFNGLGPGEYTVGASVDAGVGVGAPYETARAKSGDTVRLRRLPTGTLTIRMPVGMKADEPLPGTLPVGRHYFMAVQGDVTVHFNADIEAGEETTIDLNGSGEVVVHGEEWDSCELVLGDITYGARIGESGLLRFTNLPAGDYTLKSDLRRRLVRVARGAVTTVTLTRGKHRFEGMIRVVGGGPAQGAAIEITPAQDPDAVPEDATTDLKGRFRFEGLPAGEYIWRVEMDGYAIAKGAVTVWPERVSAPRFPLTLKRSAGVRIRVLGPLGEPISAIARMDRETLSTDMLGYLTIDRVPATLDLDLRGYASIRGMRITGPGTIQLERGADLVVLLDPEAGELEVRVDGQIWELPRFVGERLVLHDLPPGTLQITQTPKEREDEEAEPQIAQTQLIAGEQITVDLRD